MALQAFSYAGDALPVIGDTIHVVQEAHTATEANPGRAPIMARVTFVDHEADPPIHATELT
jgi:hypothetical protein